jgi:hypothetical protein
MIGAGKTRSKQAVCQRIGRRVVSGVEMILPVKIRKRKRKTLLRWRFRPIRYREEKPRKAWASRAGVLVLFGETRKQVGQGRFRKIRKSRKCRSELRPDLCRILQLHLLPRRKRRPVRADVRKNLSRTTFGLMLSVSLRRKRFRRIKKCPRGKVPQRCAGTQNVLKIV